MSEIQTEPAEPPERARRAQAFFDDPHNLEGQLEWYEMRAAQKKNWHVWLSLTTIAAGASTTVVQVFGPLAKDALVPWTAWLTALLGALVVVSKGIERIWKFDEDWAVYRLAAESMKRERRLYVNGADAYAGVTDEDAAYRMFVERIEEVIAREQHAYWQRKAGGDGDSERAAG